MKIYPKTFENVFSEDRFKKFDFSHISAQEMTANEYAAVFRDLLKGFADSLFEFYVKFAWLKKKFTYKGQVAALKVTGGEVDYAFSSFLRKIVGNDTQFFTKSFLYHKITSYFKDLFPDFERNDPFKNPELYQFPFENISIEFLAVVYQLDDRLALLKYADKQKMNYARFLDFVINQTYSINEELGRDKYIFIHSKKCQSYVKDTDKNLFFKKDENKRKN